MALCKKCLGEWHPELEVCPRCGVPLLVDDPKKVSEKRTFDMSTHVEVYRSPDRAEALFRLGFLQAEGLQVNLLKFDPQTETRVYRVFVQSRSEKKARQLLEGYELARWVEQDQPS